MISCPFLFKKSIAGPCVLPPARQAATTISHPLRATASIIQSTEPQPGLPSECSPRAHMAYDLPLFEAPFTKIQMLIMVRIPLDPLVGV